MSIIIIYEEPAIYVKDMKNQPVSFSGLIMAVTAMAAYLNQVYSKIQIPKSKIMRRGYEDRGNK